MKNFARALANPREVRYLCMIKTKLKQTFNDYDCRITL